MKEDVFSKLMTFLDNLEQGKISYTLAHHRDETIMVMVTVPGERLEAEFFADGSVEVEKFVSNGEIFGEEIFGDLLARHSDGETDNPGTARNLRLVVGQNKTMKKVCPVPCRHGQGKGRAWDDEY